MKIPFTFGLSLFYRLLIPGFVLALAFAPALHTLVGVALPALARKLDPLVVFPLEILFWGWLVTVLDMHIYMLLEGRRYWPGFLRAALIRSEAWRLEELQSLRRHYRGRDERRRAELIDQQRHFPINDQGDPEAMYPTRLGNLIAAFERYPWRVYGLDLYFWYPIWLGLDKDTREEIGNSQAVKDSGAYVTVSLLVAAVVLAAYAVVLDRQWLGLAFLSGAAVPAWGAGAALAAAFLVYRASLEAHAEFGRLYMAMFDRHHGSLTYYDDVIAEIGWLTDDNLSSKSSRERNRALIRCLQWDRFRRPGEDRNITRVEAERLRRTWMCPFGH